ncbi:hypothetical protein [Mammaliicoccus phage vB_MscM-PMS3]|nr:hypothetical protein [Mammaliicoccus phage vB_MscM-PMS3]
MTKNRKPLSRNSVGQWSYKRQLARYKGTYDYSKTYNGKGKDYLKKQSGRYDFIFSKMYHNVSDKDIELKEKYAIDLVSRYTGINKKYLRLTLYNDNIDITTSTYNYYVLQGKVVRGKVSIRVQYTFSSIILIFTYSEKRHISNKKY